MTSSHPGRRPTTRLIDLRIRWLDQYAPDCGWTALAPDPETLNTRKSRLEGYLSSTAAAVLVTPCHLEVPDPWRFLNDLLARHEAEFCGRLLYSQADANRWRDEPDDSLTWGLLAVEGCNAIPDRLPDLWNRGVRLFQPATGLLPSARLDPGALQATLDTLEALSSPSSPPHPAFDFTGLDLETTTRVFDWFEASVDRPNRLIPILTCGGIKPESESVNVNQSTSWPLSLLARLRALGGTIGLYPGPPWHPDTDSLALAIERLSAFPFQGHPGPQGLCLATCFPQAPEIAPKLNTAPGLIHAITKNSAFDPATAEALLHGNARDFLTRLVGKTA